MRRRAATLRRVLPYTWLALLPTLSRAASPTISVGELARCAAVTAADERLACYDALARSKVPAKPATSADTASRAPASVAVSQAPVTAAAPAAGAGAFGLTPHQAPAAAGPDEIRAQVTQLRVDNRGMAYLGLDNGQWWTFQDPDPRLKVGDVVSISRAALGSFLMKTPSHHSYRVERAK
jgi:hypothetical protein